MNISLSLNEAEAALVQNYAEHYGISVADFLRQSVMQWIEDEEDRKACQEAMAEYRANPVTYSHAEAGKMLGLTE